MGFSRAKRDGSFLKLFEFILYVIFVVLGFYIAFMIRFKGNPPPYNLNPFYQNMPYIALCAAFIFYITKITSTYKKTLFGNVAIIGVSLLLIDIITATIMFFTRGFAFPRTVFALGFLIQMILIFSLKLFILRHISKKYEQRGVLIITSPENSDLLTEDFLSGEVSNGGIKSICRSVDQYTYHLIDEVDKVYVDCDIPSEDKVELIRYCSIKNKMLYIIPSLFEIAFMNSKVRNHGDVVFLRIEPLGLSFEQKVVKRIMDVMLSLVGLILTSPLFLIIALLIKLDDKGPVFYKQERVTENNKTFKLCKFRTMIVNAEEDTGPTLALKDDPRITRVGRILRSTRLDELPQLINVLKGEMSIVGPRPERPHFVEKFDEEIEEYKYRLFVKAGITGLAQIFGKYTTSPKHKAKFDLLYIKNYSLLLDIKIILNTVKVIFKKESSMGVQEGDLQDVNAKLIKEFNIKDYPENTNFK